MGREKDLASSAPVKAPSFRRSLTALVTAFWSAASSAARCTRMRWYALRVALSSASRSALRFLRLLSAWWVGLGLGLGLGLRVKA